MVNHPTTRYNTLSKTTACTIVALVRLEPDRSATASAAIPVSRRCGEFLSLVLNVGGVAPCRLSYPSSLKCNEIGDGGAGAVAAAAGTMPCLETLKLVIALFPLYPHFLLFPLSHQSLPLLEGHIMEDREEQTGTGTRVVREGQIDTSWRTDRDRQRQGHELNRVQSFQKLLHLYEGHIMEDREGQTDTGTRVVRVQSFQKLCAFANFDITMDNLLLRRSWFPLASL